MEIETLGEALAPERKTQFKQDWADLLQKYNVPLEQTTITGAPQ
jgi:hypothetical protein